MARKKLKFEHWRSSMNQEEFHYFRVNKGKGYQRHQYVFGYNPQIIKVKRIDDDLWELTLK